MAPEGAIQTPELSQSPAGGGSSVVRYRLEPVMIPRRSIALIAALVLLSSSFRPSTLLAQSSPSLSGAWVLNPALTQGPREVGFETSLVPDPATDPTHGRRESSPGGQRIIIPKPQSADDAMRVNQLTDEVRQPSKRLTIADVTSEIVVTDEQGQVRRFHPTGQAEPIQMGEIPVTVTTTRTGAQVTVVYEVERGRQLRYTFSRAASPDQLVVDIEFVGKGGGDKVRHVYEPPSATPQTTSGAPAADTPASHPGDEFKNLKTIGVVLDDLTAQATSCGLTQSAIETAIVRRLTDAGFTVHRYQDQSPYVFVEIATSSVGNGLCVSRYDVTLTTHAMTTLSYQQTPVLAEITLLREGGLTGGNPGVHAENVTHGLLQYVDQFIARIRDANK
jgi:hypothetical protein